MVKQITKTDNNIFTTKLLDIVLPGHQEDFIDLGELL
jgi:hypothetical protein